MRAGEDDPQGFLSSYIRKLMKDGLGGSYPVINITPIFSGGRQLLAFGYKYNYRNVLEFIAYEGSGNTEPGDPYLSSFPDIYSNVSVLPVVFPHNLGRYFNSCSTIDNHNRIR